MPTEPERVTTPSRTEQTLAVGDLLERVMARLGRQDEYRVHLLRERWLEVVPDAWGRMVTPVRVDDAGRLVVRVAYSSTLQMEIQRRGRRWKELLEACNRVGSHEFADLVLEDSRRGPRGKRRKGPGPHER